MFDPRNMNLKIIEEFNQENTKIKEFFSINSDKILRDLKIDHNDFKIY